MLSLHSGSLAFLRPFSQYGLGACAGKLILSLEAGTGCGRVWVGFAYTPLKDMDHRVPHGPCFPWKWPVRGPPAKHRKWIIQADKRNKGISGFRVPLGTFARGGTGSQCQSVSSFSYSFLQFGSPVVWGLAVSIASHPHQPENKGKWPRSLRSGSQ